MTPSTEPHRSFSRQTADCKIFNLPDGSTCIHRGGSLKILDFGDAPKSHSGKNGGTETLLDMAWSPTQNRLASIAIDRQTLNRDLSLRRQKTPAFGPKKTQFPETTNCLALLVPRRQSPVVLLPG
jgi:hypothetical protein